MTRKRKPPAGLVRSSAAEYLTFVAASGTVFEDSELEEGAVLRTFRITASDGKPYDTKHDNISATNAAEEVSWDLAGGRSTPVDQARRPPPGLGSLSERRSSRTRSTCAANITRRPAFNSTRRDPSRAPARSRALGSTWRGTSPKQPGTGATSSTRARKQSGVGVGMINLDPDARGIIVVIR